MPTKGILAGPFLSVLGGECVFSSTVFTIAAGLTEGGVERYVGCLFYIPAMMISCLPWILVSMRICVDKGLV